LLAAAWLVLLYENATVACIVPLALLPISWVLHRLGFQAAAKQCQNVVAATGGFWLVVAVWHWLR
jgi:hypothetical protein